MAKKEIMRKVLSCLLVGMILMSVQFSAFAVNECKLTDTAPNRSAKNKIIEMSGDSQYIKFQGTAVRQESMGLPAPSVWWVVTVAKVISGPLPSEDTINVVIGGGVMPKGYVDSNIEPGDKVEVYGRYSTNWVSLTENSHYIKRTDVTAKCGRITNWKTDCTGKYSPGDKVGADMWFESLCGGEYHFEGVIIIRSPTDPPDKYSASQIELVPSSPNPHGEFLSAAGDGLYVRIPEDASPGLYDMKLQLWNADTNTLCDDTGWNENIFTVKDGGAVSEIVFIGTAVEYYEGSIAPGDWSRWEVKVDEIISGPSELEEQTVFVSLLVLLIPGAEPYGYMDPNIEPGDIVEVYGWYHGVASVTIYPSVDYYIKKTDGTKCGKITSWESKCQGIYHPGDKVGAEMEFENLMGGGYNFKGVIIIRSPTGEEYSSSQVEWVPSAPNPHGKFAGGDALYVTIPEGASPGKYDMKLELWNDDTGKLCDATEWVEDQFTVEDGGDCFETVPSDHWKGEYYNNKNLEGSPLMVRDDGTGYLNFDWGEDSPSTACGIGTDFFSVRWTRTLNFDSGTWRFTATTDDGMRVYVDGSLVIDKWFNQVATTYTADVDLTAGTHTIKVEYYEYDLTAVAKLSWAKGEGKEIKFTGTATDYWVSGGQIHHWTVLVDEVISGPQPCEDQVDIMVYDSEFPPPWGYVDPNLNVGDRVEVYGRYYAGHCSAMHLYGSTDYYIKIGEDKKPDLAFKEIYFRDGANDITVAESGQRVSAHLTLMNKGEKDVDKAKVELYIKKEGEDTLLDSKDIYDIAADSRLGFALYFNSPSESDSYNIYAIVDRENIVDEGPYEDNNKISTELKVLGESRHLKAKLIHPDKGRHMFYWDEERHIPIKVELFDTSNNRKIDFIENAKLEGYIDAIPIKGPKPNIKLSGLSFQKWDMDDTYVYIFDTHQYKQTYGARFRVDPKDMSDVESIAFVWGEYWVHTPSFSYPPNEDKPEDIESIELADITIGYFTIGRSECFLIDQLAYPFWYAIIKSSLVSCVSDFFLVPSLFILVSRVIEALISDNQEKLAKILAEYVIEKKLDVGCFIELLTFITENLNGVGEWAKNLQFWTLGSPGTLHVYDQDGKHVGVNSTGEIDEEIPGVFYLGPDTYPQKVIILNSSRNLKIMVKAIEEGKFNLIGEVKEVNRNQKIEYIGVSVFPNTKAEIDISISNPDYTMEIDEDGDGNIDYTRNPDSVNNLPVAQFTFSPSQPFVNHPITFYASSSSDPDGYIVTHLWGFGDGNSGTGETIEHSYTSAGNYDVTLTVTDNDGATDTITENIKVGALKAIYVPDDYPMIQAAVDAGSPGDIIIVRDGIYTENIEVNKPHLTIISENGAENCIVQAANLNDHVFYVTADHVNIRGFTVGGASVTPSSVYLADVDYCNISNNIASSNNYGIYLYKSNSNLISNNIASNNDASGICLDTSSNSNIISNNIASNNNDYGIYLVDSNSNIISNNIASNNNDYGICLVDSKNNEIYLNNFVNDGKNVNSYRSPNAWNSAEKITYTYNGNAYTSFLGNYWDDYMGSDANRDGIGDIPYRIDLDNDFYPLMMPVEMIMVLEPGWNIPTPITRAIIVNKSSGWGYTFSPIEDWTGIDYDTSRWVVGKAPFANLNPGACISGIALFPLNTTLYARYEFELEKIPTSGKLYLAYDNDISVYLNGQNVYSKQKEGCGAYWNDEITISGFNKGKNALVCVVKDRGVASFFDAELIAYGISQSDVMAIFVGSGPI